MVQKKDMGIADPNSEKPKMPPRYIDLKREILPQDEESRKKLVNAWNALLVKMKGAVDGFKEKGSNVCMHFIRACHCSFADCN